jgi:hypothetical protein
MTLFGQTLVLYLVIGTGVAGAVYLTWGGDRGMSRWFVVATAVLFWPLYLPMLLAKGASVREPFVITTDPNDELTAAIAQVDSELEAAFGCLDGWAEGVLAREKDRIRELRSAWLAQAQRIREMDQLLARPEYVSALADEPVAGEGDPRLRSSLQARRQNVERLQRLRGRAHDDLTRSLAWVREVVSMIHLAKFSGAPAARAEELVAQIAAAVEGLSELTWQEDLSSGPRPTGSVHPEPVAR